MKVRGNGSGNNAYSPTNATMVSRWHDGNTVIRIRTPNPEDVLCGRGGGINGHAGNKVFRQWVKERKEEYNLARNKKEKIAVAMQVVSQVKNQSPSGRFLTQCDNEWWVEVDEAKALAKTTQALREGAPKIRQAHNAGTPRTVEKAKKRTRKATAVEPAIETAKLDDAAETFVFQVLKQDTPPIPRYKSEQMLLPSSDLSLALGQLQKNVEKAKQQADGVGHRGHAGDTQGTSRITNIIAPLMSNATFNQTYYHNKDIAMKKRSFDPAANPAVDPFAATPPLGPESEISQDIPLLNLNTTIRVDNAVPPPTKRRKLARVHSLSLSDVDGYDPETNAENLEFVNPFLNESDVLVPNNARTQESEFNSEWKSNGSGTIGDIGIDAIQESRYVENSEPKDASKQSSSFNFEWKNNGNGSVGDVANDAIDTSSTKRKYSFGMYLNRMLSFSSSLSFFNDSDNRRVTRQQGDIDNSELSNEDYFFLDDVRK